MRKFLLPTAVLVLLAPMVSLGQDKMDNPLKNTKVGDFATYRMSSNMGGKDFAITMKQAIKAKDGNEVTLETSMNFGGKDLPGKSRKIDFTKPFDITSIMGEGKANATFEKSADGKEKVKIGDKSYDCVWQSGKVMSEGPGGMKVETEIKFWFSPTAPVSGLVKVEAKAEFGGMKTTMTMELSESGNAK